MKKILSILIITALSLVAFNASAQEVGTHTGTKGDEKVQNVTVNSVHKYSINALEGNELQWAITGDFEVFEDAAMTVSIDKVVLLASPSKYKYIFVKWITKDSDNEISVTEISAKGCSDSVLNTKYVKVHVLENTFDLSIAWSQAVTDTAVDADIADCAINIGEGTNLNYLNTISFTVTEANGVFGTNDVNTNWNYTYEYSLNGGEKWIKVEDSILTAGEVDSQPGMISVTNPIHVSTITFIRDILPSNTSGDYVFMVRIVDARDGYNTPALLENPVATATYHRLPEAATITLD